MKDWISTLMKTPAHRAAPPAPPSPSSSSAGEFRAWWQVMGFNAGPPRSLANVERRFRLLAARAHPDRGGSPGQMQALLHARAQARRQLRA